MNAIPERIFDTNSQADSDSPATFPAWLVRGWASERSRIKPADADELALARELIDDARRRGIIVSPTELGVRFENDLTPNHDSAEALLPSFGTIEDKIVENGSVPIDPATLSVNGVGHVAQQLQLPSTAGPNS